MNTTEANSAPEDKDSYVVNPPLIHSLDITSDGLIAAAGLENGKVCTLRLSHHQVGLLISLYFEK